MPSLYRWAIMRMHKVFWIDTVKDWEAQTQLYHQYRCWTLMKKRYRPWMMKMKATLQRTAQESALRQAVPKLQKKKTSNDSVSKKDWLI